MVVTLAKKLFQPGVKDDKYVAATHFLDFEFCCAGFPVSPGDRNYRPRVSADNGL
jgi:hypothetical protein